MYGLEGKVALVTGASGSREIGRAMALRLAQEGADVAVNDKYLVPELMPWDKERGWRGLDSVADEIKALGRRALAIAADISNAEQVNGMVEEAVRELGQIDILVNNAAIVPTVPFLEMTAAAWSAVITVNLTGTFLMCQAVAKHMVKRGQGGKIINISSTAGKKGVAGRAAYSASKFGVIGLTQSLALELATYKINVNAICPGNIASWGMLWGPKIHAAMKQGLTEEAAATKVYKEAGRASEIPLGRLGTGSDIANMAAFLASSQSDYMTGQSVNVNGGRLMSP